MNHPASGHSTASGMRTSAPAGSATMTMQIHDEGNNEGAGNVLRLTLREKKITWSDDVVNNEFHNKKSSKST